MTEHCADGTVVREWQIAAYDKEIEIAPGRLLPGLDLQRPGAGPDPARQRGGRLRVHFANAGTHPHTMHFHGIHSAYRTA